MMGKQQYRLLKFPGVSSPGKWMALIVMALFHSAVFKGFSESGKSSRMQMDQVREGAFALHSGSEHLPGEIVMVNWNIARGVRQAEILRAFRGPLKADLYLLQEVDWETRRAGFRKVAEEVARELSLNYLFGIEFRELAQERKRHPAFHGQATLSSGPLEVSRILRFHHQPHNWNPFWKPRLAKMQPREGGRMALVTEIQWGGRLCVFYNLHLESRTTDRGRAKQIREVIDDINAHYSQETPVVIAGDLNTQLSAASPVLHELMASGFQDVFQGQSGPLGTKVGAKSNLRIDWILVRHLQFSDARVVKLALSAHYPLIVRLAMPRADR
jgi:endonuclease/exonuclease/phosphatase family metal-dependent hydrolase